MFGWNFVWLVLRGGECLAGDEPFHLAYRLLHADHDGASHDTVPDVEFAHAFDLCDRLYVLIVEAMSGVERQSGRTRGRTGGGQFDEFVLLLIAGNFGVLSGVEFDGRGARLDRGIDLRLFRIDEQTDDDACLTQSMDHGGNIRQMATHVETAFGGDLLTFLRNERYLVRLDLAGKVDDLIDTGHFQIQLDVRRFTQQSHITILDVAAIFAEVDCDSVRPAQFCQRCRPDRIGFHGAACLAHGCHVIDVDSKFRHIRCTFRL